MKPSRNTAGLTLQLLTLLAVVLIVLSPVAPLYEPVPARDQGVYLYVGQQILDGKVPYRDVWDHKGPLVYYINALGLWMTDSVWGVWFLEVIFLFAAAVFGLLAMRMVFDPLTALSSAILCLAAFPKIVDHGNSVEEYSLLFQFVAVYFFLGALKNSTCYWNELLIGVTAALTFSLRPNNIGVHLTIGLVLAVGLFTTKERVRTFKRIAAMALGGGVVFTVIAIYFAAHNSLADLFDQVFIFNYHYTKPEELSWLAIAKGYNLLPMPVVTGVMGMIGTAIFLWQHRKQENTQKHLALLLLIAVPIQIYLSLLSGRKYMHYYIAWIPVLTFLMGFFLFSIRRLGEGIFTSVTSQKALHVVVAVGLILSFGVRPITGRLAKVETLVKAIRVQKSLPAPDYSKVEQGVYVDYILGHTQPGDYVLIWGNASVYNFLADRESPSRFVYTYAFGVPGYVTQKMADELQADIAAKKPLILDAATGDGNISRIDSRQWKDLPATEELVRFIEENYHQVDVIGPDRFRVWVPKGD